MAPEQLATARLVTTSVGKRRGHQLRFCAFMEDVILNWGVRRHAIRASYQIDELLVNPAVGWVLER